MSRLKMWPDPTDKKDDGIISPFDRLIPVDVPTIAFASCGSCGKAYQSDAGYSFCPFCGNPVETAEINWPWPNGTGTTDHITITGTGDNTSNIIYNTTTNGQRYVTATTTASSTGGYITVNY